jgi:putative hydrolase of the HAD superfamily
MNGLRHVFFDLDHTLWDFEHNSRETLRELFAEYSEHLRQGIDFDDFFLRYTQVNNQLWAQYRENRITSGRLRELRFKDTFGQLGMAHAPWMAEFGDRYLEICPTKTALMPGAVEILDYLQGRYALHLVTNGFWQTQNTKLASSGLERYFTHVITSENAGAKKPAPAIFQFAIEKAGANIEESVMVGDDYEADILGGLQFGLKVIFYNPEAQPNPLKLPEVRHLNELRGRL